METINTDDLLFRITKEQMQIEALEKFGRILSEDELNIARKGLEWGLLTGIDTVYDAIFDMIKENQEK